MFVSSAVIFSLCLLGAAPPAAVAPSQASPPGQTPGQQQQVRVEESVVVTADREPDDIRNVGSSVSVITAEQIAASGARWLVDVLQFAPGVTVVRSGPPGAVTSVFLRGTNSSHTLFLIDGVKANSPTAGGYDPTNLQISADRIERIEIVRGPQSALYGSQALGGVINVITRRGEGRGTWGSEVEGGSYRTGRVHSWVNGEAGSLRYDGSISFFDSDGFSAADRAAGNAEPDGFRDLSYNGRVDYQADGGLLARGFVRASDGEVMFDGYDFSSGPVDALANTQDTRELYAGGAVGYVAAAFSTEVEISLTDVYSESLTPDDFFSAFLLDSAMYEIDWQNDFVLPGDQRLTAGVEYRREQATIVSSSVFGDDGFDEQVDFTGVYLQDRFTLGEGAHLAAGIRYEDHSTYGGKWVGRFTASVETGEVVRLHGSVGSGFRAPTLNDLYYPGFSNPDLQPEESVGVDFGVDAAGRRARGGATYFYNDITNLIEFDAVAGVPANIGAVVSQGLEVAGVLSLRDGLDLEGNYTFTEATPEGSGEQLIRRPRHQGGVRLTWLASNALRTWAEVRFKGTRFDTSPAGRVELDPYGVVNLAADYRIGPRFLVRGRLDNLFDSEYQEIFGYGTAGIGGYIGLNVTLTRQ